MMTGKRRRGRSSTVTASVPKKRRANVASSSERDSPSNVPVQIDEPEIVQLCADVGASGRQGSSVSGAAISNAWQQAFQINDAPNPPSNFPPPTDIRCADDDLTLHVTPDITAKIWNHDYINLAVLLKKDVSESASAIFVNEFGALETKPKKQKSIMNIHDWTDAFLIFMSVYIKRYTSKVSELLQYISVIRDAENRTKSFSWKVYDEQFRLRQSVSLQSWAKINPDLWLRTMTLSNYNDRPTSQPYRQFAQPRPNFGPQRRVSGVCFDYNKKECYFRACKYAHLCQACKGEHPAFKCPRVLQTQPFRDVASPGTGRLPTFPNRNQNFSATAQYGARR